MNMHRLTTACLAPALAAALFAACGGGDGLSVDNSKSLQERLFSGNETDFAEQQRLIGECMVKQGFEYTAQDNRDSGDNGVANLDPRSEEFVKEYGFGISTLFATQLSIRPADSDPNQKYRNSLSEAQQKAYDKALYGAEFAGNGTFSSSSGGIAIQVGGGTVRASDGNAGESPAPEIVAPSGCIGEALKATGGGPQRFDASLFDDLEELEDRIRADSRVVEAMKKWSACMDDAGYEYRDIEALEKEIRTEFGDLTGLKTEGEGGGFVISVSATAGIDGDGKAFDPFANVDKQALARLQDKEKRIALVAFNCAGDLLKVEQKVREKYEADFLADHPELKD